MKSQNFIPRLLKMFRISSFNISSLDWNSISLQISLQSQIWTQISRILHKALQSKAHRSLHEATQEKRLKLRRVFSQNLWKVSRTNAISCELCYLLSTKNRFHLRGGKSFHKQFRRKRLRSIKSDWCRLWIWICILAKKQHEVHGRVSQHFV